MRWPFQLQVTSFSERLIIANLLCATAVLKEDATVGHVPFNMAPAFSTSYQDTLSKEPLKFCEQPVELEKSQLWPRGTMCLLLIETYSYIAHFIEFQHL